jgi:hypothetical protein
MITGQCMKSIQRFSYILTKWHESIEGSADEALPAFQDTGSASSLTGELLMQGWPM